MTPATWLEELNQELTARGLATADVAGIVVELQSHLVDSSEHPLDTFGPPALYAATLAASVLPEPPVPRGAGRPRVVAQGVTVSVGRRPVLLEVDLVVRSGEVVLLIGANGVGKSTLMRIVAGLARPDRGQVRVRGSVGYAPQAGGLFDHLRPTEHFLLFGHARGLTRRESVRAGCRVAEQLGWDAMAGPVVAELSGGTRQKLNVALAALGDADVMLLDEPTQGLDFDSTRRFWELVWTWREQRRAVLVVSHGHDALERVDEVVEIASPKRAVAA